MSCRLCKGDLSPSTTTHAVDTGKSLIVVRNVPCLKCTQCGETVYTGDTVEQLLAWDPDFTKLTAKERAELEEAENDPETVPMDAINWD